MNPHNQTASQLPALTRLPPPPAALLDDEKMAWREVGSRAVKAGLLTAADLTLLETVAVLTASVRLLRAYTRLDPADVRYVKASTLTGQARLQIDALRQLGLTPNARGSVVAPRPVERKNTEDEFA